MNKKLLIIIAIVGGIFVLIIAGIFYFFANYSFVQINGPAMSPTLKDGSYCLSEKTFTPQKEDIVVYKAANRSLVHRIKGVEGDTFDEKTLKAGEFYMIGDNENNSLDSRSTPIGIVKRSQIVGKITQCF